MRYAVVRSAILSLLCLAVSWRGEGQVLCCISQQCQSVADVTACSTAGGIEGYCRIGQACGAAACDPLLVQPIRLVRGVKAGAGGADVFFGWNPDAGSDRYHTSYVTNSPPTIATACGSAGWTPVPASGVSTVPEIVHAGAVAGSAGTTFYYCTIGECGVAAPSGSCCEPRTPCRVDTDVNCAGTWTAGGTCSPDPCPGSCCEPGNPCRVDTQANCTGTFGPGGDV